MGQSLTEIAQSLLDANKKIQLIYAFNGSGKTRLSREFKELIAPKNPHTEEEETKIKKEDYDLEYKGILTWSVDNNRTIYGLYIFVCKLKKLNLKFPIKTSEGILDLKEINWVIDHNNLGVSHNLKYILPYALYKDELYRYHCLFEGNTLLSVDITLLEE
mgnify:CR=1 FL=1